MQGYQDEPKEKIMDEEELERLLGNINIPSAISLGKTYGMAQSDFTPSGSWDANFGQIAPDFSSGAYDIGDVEALKAAPFGMLTDTPVSYYDTYSGPISPDENTFNLNKIGHWAQSLLGDYQKPNQVASTGLLNALDARLHFDPRNEQIYSSTFAPSLERLDIMPKQEWHDSVHNLWPSDIEMFYDSTATPTSAVINEHYLGPFSERTTNITSSPLADSGISAQAIREQDIANEVAAQQASSMGERTWGVSEPVNRSTGVPAIIGGGSGGTKTVTVSNRPPAKRTKKTKSVKTKSAGPTPAQREEAANKALFDAVKQSMDNMRDRGETSARDVQAAINAMQGNEFGGVRGFEPGMDATGFTDTAGYGVG